MLCGVRIDGMADFEVRRQGQMPFRRLQNERSRRFVFRRAIVARPSRYTSNGCGSGLSLRWAASNSIFLLFDQAAMVKIAKGSS